MPTIREIADAAGCSKPHVAKVLRELGLWETHTRMEGRVRVVDDHAAGAAASAIARTSRGSGRAAPSQAAPVADQAQSQALAAVYERQVALLLDRVAAAEADKADLRSRLDAAEAARADVEARARRAESALHEVMGRGLVARVRNDRPRALIGDEAGP